jgi:hypothetical protein
VSANFNNAAAVMRALRILVAAAGWLCMSFGAQAQSGYQSGYVITQGRDTLYGLVKDRTSPPFQKLYKRVRFKRPGKITKRYGPARLLAYARGDLRYQSQWLEKRWTIWKAEYISVPGQGERKFLKVVHTGYLTWYQLEVMDHDSFTVDLVDLFKRQSDSYMVRVTQGILGLKRKNLEKYFQDYPDLAGRIARAELRDPLEIARAYNAWWESLR